MTETAELLVTDGYRALVRRLRAVRTRTLSDEALAHWLLPAENFSRAADELAAAAAPDADQNYQAVAALGFLRHEGLLSTQHSAAFARGLHRLVGRASFIDENPMSFCTDAIALLGIALGASKLDDATLKQDVARWLSSFLGRVYNLPRVHDWQRCVFAAVQLRLGLEPALTVPRGADVGDVRVALRAAGELSGSAASTDELEALTLVRNQDPETLETCRALIRLAAFKWIQRVTPMILPGRATIDDVASLLRRLPDGLRKWTWEEKSRTSGANAVARKWHIDNEYHVQNLLYTLLASVFPDLCEEENFPSVGHKKPRPDLYIPSLKLIVEVKFVRARTVFQDIIGEIAEDAGLYLAGGSSYTEIVAFVWDDSRRSEDHALLIRGATALSGVRDAIVVSRPGSMIDTSQGM